jgi:hypothetical protein
MIYDFHTFRKKDKHSDFRIVVYKYTSYVGWFSFLFDMVIKNLGCKNSNIIGQWKVKNL